MRHRSWLGGLAIVVAAGGCGQSADVVGERNHVPPPPVDTGWETDFEACATERIEASLVTTNLFLAVDRSCSMADPAAGATAATPPSKWDAATSAFSSFFTDPDAATLDVALRLWPDSDGCDAISCDPVACSDPQVPLGSVGDSAHQQALIDALVGSTPYGNTPMHAALDGAVRWATDHLASAPDEHVAIVLVTDGEPNGCDEDIANIASLAANASSIGVPVYAVGIEGSNVDQINQIASAGQTGDGYFVGSTDAEAELLAALEDIQAKALTCEYTFPSESTSDPLSPALVRVEYTVGDEIVSVPRVADEAACEPNGGWYLDDPADPSTITVCPSTCDAIQGLETVAIEIDVGCECVTDDDCPGDQICGEDGCVPPCEGPDCPPPPVLGAVTGRYAVQGGALSCATASGPASALLLLVGFLLSARRLSARSPRDPREVS